MDAGSEVYVTAETGQYADAYSAQAQQMSAPIAYTYYPSSVGQGGPPIQGHQVHSTPHTQSVAPPLFGPGAGQHYIVQGDGLGGLGGGVPNIVGSSVTITGNPSSPGEDSDDGGGGGGGRYLGIAGPVAIAQATHATRASPVTVQWLLENYETSEGVSLPRALLYSHYLRHCGEHRIDPMNPASFGKLIRSVFLGLRTRRLGTLMIFFSFLHLFPYSRKL